MLMSFVLYGLMASELVGVKALVSADLAAVGDHLPAARLALTQTLHWVSDFDARLLGCPTIIIQPH